MTVVLDEIAPVHHLEVQFDAVFDLEFHRSKLVVTV